MVINWFKSSLFDNNKEDVLETVGSVIILLCSILIMKCHLRFSNVQGQLFSDVLLLLSLIDGLKFVSAHFLTGLSRFSTLNYFDNNSELYENAPLSMSAYHCSCSKVLSNEKVMSLEWVFTEIASVSFGLIFSTEMISSIGTTICSAGISSRFGKRKISLLDHVGLNLHF